MIRSLVDANAGRATLRGNEPDGSGGEADFLGLGCGK
jgi:hypothetical protein